MMVSKVEYEARKKEVSISYAGEDGMPITESTRTQFTQYSVDSTELDKRESEREIFTKAREYLNPGWLFRLVMRLYAERKLVVFFWLHFFSTLVIWVHFFLIKFQEQEGAVPPEAHRYWLKRLAPPLEFGSMHAILFQMTLLPITMSRFSIAAFTESFIDRIVPLNRMLRMHIHLGYTMVIVLFASTCFFFFFFGILCAEGEQDFCDKFTTEIMATGYAILGLMLIIGGTSYFRHRMPYELFYAIHHLVFIMYFVTIAHTLDREQRQGNKERSQTFKWFSSTLLYYFCDRAAMHLNHRYEARLLGSSTVSGSNGSKMVILKLKRPVLMTFKPGQYAFLNCSMIDNSWHPFSIASCPGSSKLEFYIEVYAGNAWTNRLWDILERASGDDYSSLLMTFDVMGPYGTSIAKTKDFSHVLAIGAGTGIVPVLSLYKQHIRDMLRLEPGKFFSTMSENERKIRQIESALEPRKGSLAQKAFHTCVNNEEHQEGPTQREEIRTSIHQSIEIHDMLVKSAQQTNIREMKKAASKATYSIYGVVLLTSLPIFGMTVFALTVSWNTIPIDLYPGMIEILKILTMGFQAMFTIVACFVWHANSLVSYVDIVMCIISPFADLYWIQICQEYDTLRPVDILTYSILTLYMTFRLWAKAVMPRDSTSARTIMQNAGPSVDRLNFVWTTRSASLVSEILPDILSLWDLLASKWGPENAAQVCPISIHVTDPDSDACDQLRREYDQTDLYQSGGMKFGRADLSRVIEDHSLDMVGSRGTSQSLLAFCGSPQLAREIHSYKISNDMVLAITGNKKHQMDFVSESYGGVKKKVAKLELKDDTGGSQSSECKDMKPLTTRRNMSYTDSLRMFNPRKSIGSRPSSPSKDRNCHNSTTRGHAKGS